MCKPLSVKLEQHLYRHGFDEYINKQLSSKLGSTVLLSFLSISFLGIDLAFVVLGLSCADSCRSFCSIWVHIFNILYESFWKQNVCSSIDRLSMSSI